MGEISKPLVEAAASEDAFAGVEGEPDAISESELREFLAADAFGAPADPEFKRALQGRLWEIVQTQLQKKRRYKWLPGWRRREVPSAEGADRAAKVKR